MPINGRAARPAAKSRTSPGQTVLDGLTALEPNKTTRAEPEFIEQRTLFYHLDEWAKKYPVFGWIHAIPNGLALTPRTAVKAKQQGVRAGIWDVFVPARRHGMGGLYIEMKAGKNKLTDPQKAFALHIDSEGYARCVCYSWTAAARAIVDYLGIRDEWIDHVISINS